MERDEDINIALKAWQKTIDVQEHFNDLELRIRGMAVTILTTALGAAGIALSIRTRVPFFGSEVPLAPLVIFAGLVGWLGFYFMDAFWYHRLLRGAVKHAQSIEDRFKERYPSMSLSNAITDESRFILGPAKWKVTAGARLHFFYISITACLAVLAGYMLTA